MVRRSFLYFGLWIVLILSSWLSTGTMAPYAATLYPAKVDPECHYLVNLDHPVFEDSFKFLDGAPIGVWKNNPILRRILYPIIGYPFMKALGFITGGVILNFILLILTSYVFLKYVAKVFDRRAEIQALLLLSTYPGITYWIGLPYSYACIIPCSLLSFILLHSTYKDSSPKRMIFSALGIGVLAVFYDLLPFFGCALLFLLLLQKRILALPLALLLVILPTVVTLTILGWMGAELVTSNSASYGNIINSYFQGTNLDNWLRIFSDLPELFIYNFFQSNFYVLPALFLIVYGVGRLKFKFKLSQPELALGVAVAAVFLFNNCAPPYEGWQLRGAWVARIYQPLFVAMIFYVVRFFYWYRNSEKVVQLAGGTLCLTFMLQAVIVFGPVLSIPLSSKVYHDFYHHSPDSLAMWRNINIYGKRPLGFCRKRLSREVRKRLKQVNNGN